MAITITRAEIKRKCMMPSTDVTHDSDLDALIAEVQPSIEYTLADAYLNDTANVKLQAVLKLGILEVLSGEFMKQLYREAGEAEDFSVGGVSVGAKKEHGTKLVEQGMTRLKPFLKPIDVLPDEAAISSTTINTDRTFTASSMEVW